MKIIIAVLLVFISVFSQPLSFESGEKKVYLIELYSSEGCSSCPVADEWLNGLTIHKQLFKTFIPMAFHVTYWDFIGWKDSFGNVMHDHRQRDYASRVWKNNSVYTPQFVIDAKEYRQWFSNQRFPRFKDAYGGNLKVTLENSMLDIKFETKKMQNQKVYVNSAVLGFDYKIAIKSGENNKKTLHHDFVVLKHHQHFANIVNNQLHLLKALPLVKQDKHPKALVIWISDEKRNIIQATASYLPN